MLFFNGEVSHQWQPASHQQGHYADQQMFAATALQIGDAR